MYKVQDLMPPRHISYSELNHQPVIINLAKSKGRLNVAPHSFKPTFGGQTQADLCEFKGSLVYRVSCLQSWSTEACLGYIVRSFLEKKEK